MVLRKFKENDTLLLGILRSIVDKFFDNNYYDFITM